ncbi:synaptic vesicle membrane protein VAT-1 homolog-like [Cloeon dipterum]|uniref:synaptic vesicle membrane protein VAT-1 homolog-like n=1 Tax=Cloeon dipterum TaxID=197152 RepID=UPI0032203F35
MPEKQEKQPEQETQQPEPEAKVEEEQPKEEAKKEEEAAPAAEPPKEMRAVVLTAFGGLKSVKTQKKPEPSPQEGEILVSVSHCGLNFQDLMARQGAIDAPPKTPFILGSECAGEVVQVGAGVENFQVGQRVVCLPEFRAWAELVCVPARLAFALPDDVTNEEAAALAMNALAAYMLLFQVAGLSEGQSVLLHSAGGGIGLAIAQLARTKENVTLIGVASKSKHEAIKDHFDHLLERGCDYVSEVRKISPDGVDLVLDCLCLEDCNRGYSLLKPMGKYVLYGSSNVVTGETKSFFSVARSWWQVDKVSPIKLFDENKTIAGFNLRHLLRTPAGAERARAAMEKVMELWKNKVIKPIIDSSWALEDVPEAMQVMHDRKNIGKLILNPALEPKPRPATPAKKGSKEEKSKKKDKEEKKDEKKEEKPAENGDSSDKKEEEEEKKEPEAKQEDEKAAEKADS